MPGRQPASPGRCCCSCSRLASAGSRRRRPARRTSRRSSRRSSSRTNGSRTATLTVQYGVRWEAQIEPDPITPPSEVFFAPFIGKPGFPSDGTIPSDKKMFQPRLGISWDPKGDGKQVVRVSAGVFYSRVFPGLDPRQHAVDQRQPGPIALPQQHVQRLRRDAAGVARTSFRSRPSPAPITRRVRVRQELRKPADRGR